MQNAIAYLRVSTLEQAVSGAGLKAQRAAILAEAERRGWKVVAVIEDAGFSGKNLRRPGIEAALKALAEQRADVLIVSKLDRLSRSMLDFASLMQKATREHWGLVALDLGVDTSTPAGEAMAHVLATFAQFERRLIGQRTKEGMAQKRREGTIFGRDRKVPADVRARIAAERVAGRSLAAIAAGLNEDGVATGQGGRKWYPSTVAALLRSISETGS